MSIPYTGKPNSLLNQQEIRAEASTSQRPSEMGESMPIPSSQESTADAQVVQVEESSEHDAAAEMHGPHGAVSVSAPANHGPTEHATGQARAEEPNEPNDQEPSVSFQYELSIVRTGIDNDPEHSSSSVDSNVSFWSVDNKHMFVENVAPAPQDQPPAQVEEPQPDIEQPRPKRRRRN